MGLHNPATPSARTVEDAGNSMAASQPSSLPFWLGTTSLVVLWPMRWFRVGAKGRFASLGRGLWRYTKVLLPTNQMIGQRWIATAPVAPVVHWGLGRLLWHQFDLQLKASYHSRSHSTKTNGSRCCSKAADSVGMRTSCWPLHGHTSARHQPTSSGMRATHDRQSAVVTHLLAWSHQSDCLVYEMV